MKTIISNRIYVYDASVDLLFWARDNLTITNPTWATLKRLGKDDTISRKHISEKMKLYVENGSDLILPFGCLYAIWPNVKKEDYEIKLNNNDIVINQNWHISTPLFDYQEVAVQKMLSAKGGVLVAPCSAGKTNIMIEIIKRIGKKFLFLVHTSDLLQQFYNRAKSLYPELDIGKITEGEFNVGKHGAVATIQTLDKIDNSLYKNLFDTVVVDECVHVSGSPTLSKMFSRVLENTKARYKFGCTATPSRSDTMIKSMYAILGCNEKGEFAPVYQISRNETNSLTAEHVKVETHVPFDYSILNDDGTFDYIALIDYLSNNKQRNELIIAKTKEMLSDGRKTLLLCHRIEQCKILYEHLINEGIKAELLIGKISSKKRESILTESVDYDVIVATLSLCKEGIDIKSLEAEILCTPINDKGMVVQCVGRVERFKEGKRTPLVLDLCDENIPYCLNRFKKRVGYLKRRY